MSPEELRGSSPRPRGTLATHFIEDVSRRFIPASAGNTVMPPSGLASGAVHPRVRGEHYFFFRYGVLILGSSPRPRGTLFSSADKKRRSRFIPASAGNT